MFEYIKGIYIGLNKEYIIVENAGIGYKIFSSGNTISNMPQVDENVIVYIEQIVREDFNGLYGFLSKEERNMFNELRSINGVGAKAALSLLSVATVENLKYAIMQGDEVTIIKAPGVGKKTAQRIILEMKDKFSPEELLEGSDSQISIENSQSIFEAKEALISLGYVQKEVEKVISKLEIDEKSSVEIIIKKSLLELMNTGSRR